MRHWSLLFLLLTASGSILANCHDLYRAEDQRLTKKFGETQRVGSQWSLSGGQVQYFPGWRVSLAYESWVDTFLGAIHSGDRYESMSLEEEKLLRHFKRNIKEVCPLEKEDYTGIRVILKGLLDDQSFCPHNKILKHGFLNQWKEFDQVIIDAIQSGKFQEVCASSLRIDQSDRGVINKQDSMPSSGDKELSRPSSVIGQ